jgi:hypothetical protein
VKQRGFNVQRIDDEGRLNLLVQRRRLNANLARQLTELAQEADQPLPSRASAAGSWEKLRGIPALGRGVGGAIRGTRPDQVFMPEGVTYQLAVLATGIDGTSPGTQPEEALLEAERETEALLRAAGRIT